MEVIVSGNLPYVLRSMLIATRGQLIDGDGAEMAWTKVIKP